MADFNYTKGEWKIIEGDDAFIITDEKGCTICKMPYIYGIRIKIQETDAHLIAAAVNACQKINPDNPLAVAEALPDMYEALKAFRPVFLTRNDFHQVCFLKEDELWEAVEQALAKAEGKVK